MELHKALRHIIETEGQDIIKEIRLVNILDDFNAYQDIPASKYILRAIIVDGYSSKLLQIGKWDNFAKALSTKFHSLTGFKEDVAVNIFQSLAFGLGFISYYNPISQGTNNPAKLDTQVLITDNDFAKLSRLNQEQYLSGLIEVDPNIKSQLGIEIKSNVVIKAPTLYLNLEAKGKLKQKYNVSIFAAVYNKNDEMKGLRKVMIFDSHPILSPICCSSVFFDGFLTNRNFSEICFEYNISKILIYAERDLY